MQEYLGLLVPHWNKACALTVTPTLVGSLPSTRLKMDTRASSWLWPLNLFGANASRALWKSSKLRTLDVFCLTHDRTEETQHVCNHSSSAERHLFKKHPSTESHQHICLNSLETFEGNVLSNMSHPAGQVRVGGQPKTLTSLWRRQCQHQCWWRSCHRWSDSLCTVWPSSSRSAPSRRLWCLRGQQTSEKRSEAAPCPKSSP